MIRLFLMVTLLALVGCDSNSKESVVNKDIPAVPIEWTMARINAADSDVVDTKGWAVDIHRAIRSNELSVTKENICAVIAICSQESGFKENPSVPNLGKISSKAVKEKLEKYPVIGKAMLDYIETTPSVKNSYMKRIAKAKTEKDLDLVYWDMSSALTEKFNLTWVVSGSLFAGTMEGGNDITTIGSMQSSVRYAIEHHEQVIKESLELSQIRQVRDSMYTRFGGLYYGTNVLLKYDSGYKYKIHRFADYNAGRYASRNAGFQQMVSQLSGAKLATDGDVLLYNGDGGVKIKPSNTEEAVVAVLKKSNIERNRFLVRKDLSKEKESSFSETDTYKAIANLYTKTGKPVIKETIPKIAISSEKMKGFSTERYANNVKRRYDDCIK